jgi:hypothetical protein
MATYIARNVLLGNGCTLCTMFVCASDVCMLSMFGVWIVTVLNYKNKTTCDEH